MTSFRQFFENKFADIMKKQLRIPKNIWVGMPILVGNVKLGGKKIVEPTTFIVKKYDDNSVVLSASVEEPAMPDDDGEFDVSKNLLNPNQEFVVSIEQFYKMIEPPPGQASGGGMGMGSL